MENHPIDNLIKNTMENLKEMIDVNTIVGNSIQTNDGSLIIPISKVSFGFASGGSEFDGNIQNPPNMKYPFGGGSGAGVTVKPVAFIVIKDGSVRVLSLDHTNTYDKLVDSVPQILDILKDMKKEKKDNKNKENNKDNKSKCNDDVFSQQDTAFYACDNEIRD
ncbi:putative spore protein YtfJ [Clostridium acetireducens DSM 10703]|jgi:sporulation protein YtfJ|uniref:Putative spore protein YtfJ n=1 Tax=Clostridium acetireducens DSM 10703 TaxID=1121290 RepID=A0A1E8F2P3_9CLOT|nr:GerW family sporulation protein [Clostridium acetireducens]OFI07619.1 putative spore protein YtfJ [Clostridium acetireducens DSM 10703]